MYEIRFRIKYTVLTEYGDEYKDECIEIAEFNVIPPF